MSKYHRIYYCKNCNVVAFEVIGRSGIGNSKPVCFNCDNVSYARTLQVVPEEDFSMSILKRERLNINNKIMSEKRKYKVNTITNPYLR
ncbi:hypothetical protein DRQ25_12435 [Candidatus Fermentibacteria bacterium]|nr:MAG: hypothetical protein DRQ25_12435 [Candidatus Fermentibacteria bacterium]